MLCHSAGASSTYPRVTAQRHLMAAVRSQIAGNRRLNVNRIHAMCRWLLASASVSWIAMVVSNHDDPIALKTLLEKYMVGKFLEITPPHSAGIVMMPLRIGLDGIDGIIQLTPKLIIQLPGNSFILRRNLSGIFRSPRVNDQSLHRASLPSAKLAEFIPRNTDDFSRVHFGGSMLSLLILDPVVSVFKAAKKQNRQFSSLWLRETYDGFPDLCEFTHGLKLSQVRAHSSPNL